MITSQTRPIDDVAELLGWLRTLRPRRLELDLQSSVRNLLTMKRIEHNAEHRLDAKNRLDFYLETAKGYRIAVETKARAAVALATARQIRRYVLTGKIDWLILVTTYPLSLPAGVLEFEGKVVPVIVVDLSLNSLT